MAQAWQGPGFAFNQFLLGVVVGITSKTHPAAAKASFTSVYFAVASRTFPISAATSCAVAEFGATHVAKPTAAMAAPIA